MYYLYFSEASGAMPEEKKECPRNICVCISDTESRQCASTGGCAGMKFYQNIMFLP